MVECELENDSKFVAWIERQLVLSSGGGHVNRLEDYKALPVEVRRGWREQFRRDHGIPTSAEVVAKILNR